MRGLMWCLNVWWAPFICFYTLVNSCWTFPECFILSFLWFEVTSKPAVLCTPVCLHVQTPTPAGSGAVAALRVWFPDVALSEIIVPLSLTLLNRGLSLATVGAWDDLYFLCWAGKERKAQLRPGSPNTWGSRQCQSIIHIASGWVRVHGPTSRCRVSEDCSDCSLLECSGVNPLGSISPTGILGNWGINI